MDSTIQKEKVSFAQEDQFTFLENQLPEVEFHAWSAQATALKIPTLENEATEGHLPEKTLGLAKEVPEDIHEISLRAYVVDFSRNSSSCTQVQQMDVIERVSSDAKKRMEKRGKVVPYLRTILRKIPFIKYCTPTCLKL